MDKGDNDAGFVKKILNDIDTFVEIFEYFIVTDKTFWKRMLYI